MKLKIKKNQTNGGRTDGERPHFEVNFLVELTEVEREAIHNYKFSDVMIYDHVADVDGEGFWAALDRALKIRIKFSDLVDGITIAMPDLYDITFAERKIIEEVRKISELLEAALEFGGEKIIDL